RIVQRHGRREDGPRAVQGRGGIHGGHPGRASGPHLLCVQPRPSQRTGGQVDLTCFAFSTALRNAQAGKLRAIAVGGTKRNPQLPDVPSISELLPGYSATSWTALVPPPRTPAPVAQKLAP